MPFQVGDLVSVDVQLGTLGPPVGTIGIVSHNGPDLLCILPGQVSPASDSTVVRFEKHCAHIFSPQDLTKLTAVPSFNILEAMRFKKDELVQTLKDAPLPDGTLLRKGSTIRVDSTGTYYVTATYLTSALFVLPLADVVDYWDSRIAKVKTRLPGPAFVASAGLLEDFEIALAVPKRPIMHCPVRTCAAENDDDPKVKTCWRCGNSLHP